MDNVIPFRPRPKPPEPEKQEVSSFGPPAGILAWSCRCGSNAFYMTKQQTQCWSCHEVQNIT